MFGVRRRSDEDWVDFMMRSTHESEAHAEKHGAKDWVETQKRLKWKFAGMSARHTDGRWSARMLNWRPWLNKCSGREVGRPNIRWQDLFTQIAGGDWIRHAQDASLWTVLAEMI